MKSFNQILLVLFGLSCLIPSCSDGPGKEFEACTINVKVDLDRPYQGQIRMSKYVKDVQFIPISGDESFSPVGPIVRYARGFYYIIDGESERIFKISEDGRIVARIGSQGRASNEYLSITSFDVNPSTSEVYVYEVTRNRMIVYSGEGAFIRSFSLDDTNGLFRDFVVFPNGNIIGCDFLETESSVRRGVWMVDINGNFIKQIISVDRKTRFVIGIALPLFSKIGEDTVCIMGPVGDDSIYKIDSDGKVTARYLFDFGSQISPGDLHKEARMPLPDYFFRKVCFYASPSYFNIWGAKGDKQFDIYYGIDGKACYVIPEGGDSWVWDVPNYRGGIPTDGSRLVNTLDSESLPVGTPKSDSTKLWIEVARIN